MRVSITEEDRSLRVTDVREICCELNDGTVYVITPDGIVGPPSYETSIYCTGTTPMSCRGLMP